MIFITTVINNATKDTKKLELALSKDITVLIKKEDKNTNLLPAVTLNENLKAPIKKGDVVECSEVHLLIYKTKFENLYKISFAIFDKMLYLEHDFIICKITSKYAF